MSTATEPAPSDYSTAVERYLEGSGLTEASQRIYRIALTTWAWALTAPELPSGAARRGAKPPRMALARLDSNRTPNRLAKAFAEREATAGPRTANRELAILNSALTWWREQGWIAATPTRRIRRLKARPPVPPRLTEEQAAAVLALDAPLREQTLWHLVHETGGGIERILALDVQDIDREQSQTREEPPAEPLTWQPDTARLLARLIDKRAGGPLFLADRRAPLDTPPGDVCPETGRARLSYRRAAELFMDRTQGLDPEGRGWTLRQLQIG